MPLFTLCERGLYPMCLTSDGPGIELNLAGVERTQNPLWQGAKALGDSGISTGWKGPGAAMSVPLLIEVVVGTLVGTVVVNPNNSLWSRAAARPEVFHILCFKSRIF